MWLGLAETGDQMPTTMDGDLSTSNSQRLEKVGMMRSGSFAPNKSAPPVPAKVSSLSFCLLLLRHIPLIPYLNKGLHVSIWQLIIHNLACNKAMILEIAHGNMTCGCSFLLVVIKGWACSYMSLHLQASSKILELTAHSWSSVPTLSSGSLSSQTVHMFWKHFWPWLTPRLLDLDPSDTWSFLRLGTVDSSR